MTSESSLSIALTTQHNTTQHNTTQHTTRHHLLHRSGRCTALLEWTRTVGTVHYSATLRNGSTGKKPSCVFAVGVVALVGCHYLYVEHHHVMQQQQEQEQQESDLVVGSNRVVVDASSIDSADQ
jgi:hypothetical protein